MSARQLRVLEAEAEQRAREIQGAGADNQTHALEIQADANECWGESYAYQHAAEVVEEIAKALDAMAALHEPAANMVEHGRAVTFREAARIVRGEGGEPRA